MIIFDALQSTAAVLLSLMLLLSSGVAAKAALSEKVGSLGEEAASFRLAREIDAFYRDACAPGAFCMASFHLPSGRFNSSIPVFAPLSLANWSVEGNNLLLRWEA